MYVCRSFTLQIHNMKKSRTVRQVHIYYCAQPLAELSELKTRPDLWQKVRSATSSESAKLCFSRSILAKLVANVQILGVKTARHNALLHSRTCLLLANAVWDSEPEAVSESGKAQPGGASVSKLHHVGVCQLLAEPERQQL